jgi:hypothetical protein
MSAMRAFHDGLDALRLPHSGQTLLSRKRAGPYPPRDAAAASACEGDGVS